MKKLLFKTLALALVICALLSLSSCGIILSTLLTDKTELGRIEQKLNTLDSVRPESRLRSRWTTE